MRHRPTNLALGRFYWRIVKRWPAIYVFLCCFGIAVGVGALFLFGEPESDLVRSIFLRVFGVLMLLVYGSFIAAFVARFKSGTWNSHCQRRILFFSSERDYDDMA